MPLRRIQLRILLWSLGVAAICGFVAVLTGNYASVSRVLGTALLTAGAALLMFAAGYLVDRPLTRSAGMLGMTAVVVEYLLLLAFIWLRLGDRMAMTMAFLGLPIVPAMICLTMARAAPTRIAGWFGLAACAAVCALLLGGAWFDGSPWKDDTWYSLAAAVATFFPVALVCLIGAGSDRRHWRWAGVAAAAAACAAMFYSIVNTPQGGEAIFAAVVSLAVIVAHANVLMLLPLKPRQLWLRRSAIVATIATAAFIVLSIYETELANPPPWLRNGLSARLASACAIAAGCGTLALLVLGRLNRKVPRPLVTLAGIQSITLFCPACQKKQTVPVGDAQCPSCRVLIHTRFEEPRCTKCDYSLLMLNSDRCPECGTEVPDRMMQANELTPEVGAHALETPRC